MGHPKTGKPQGRVSAFQGEKLTWLESFEDNFHITKRTSFYNSISKNFLVRYGYDLSFVENVPGAIAEWAPVDRKAGLDREELAVENNFQEQTRVSLRAKLSQWNDEKDEQRECAPAAQKRHRVLLSKILRHADEDRDFVKTKWEAESNEFRAEVEQAGEDEHTAALKVYNSTQDFEEQTAEGYHKALQVFDDVGIPLADALSERLGMHVVIMVVGPVGDQKGEVRLPSVFSDTSQGGTTKMWGQFDRTGFMAAETSLTRYGQVFFTRDQCRDRAWPPIEGAPNLDELLSMGPVPTPAAPATAPVQTAAPRPTATATVPTPMPHCRD
ncbi:hypothetical protein DFH09DRAFT_1332850 [Mycena vulgaris]|nr:hypothetical protein DFH09DRAFT_1332850 [Mycena vulgaris]